ncbi:MAG: hypothetical protein ACXABY_36250 [Candidatus Thorarchaeota archaeon]|jgi:hypothetical protein
MKKVMICGNMVAGGKGCRHSDYVQPTHCIFHEQSVSCSTLCNGVDNDPPDAVPCIELELTEKEYKGYILRWKLEGKL